MRFSFVRTLAGVLFLCSTHAFAIEDEKVYWAVMFRPTCDKHIEGFAAKAKEPYERALRTHADIAASTQTNSSPIPDSPLEGQSLEQLQSGCDVALDIMLNDGRPPDQRFATPLQTWGVFMSALRSADKETVALCIDPTDRAKYMAAIQEMTSSELATVADSFTKFELKEGWSKQFQEAVVITSEGKAGIVVFVKATPGWRISQL